MTEFVKKIRDEMQVTSIMQNLLLFGEFKEAGLDILKEFNSIKAVLSNCALDRGSQRVVLLPELLSMLQELQIKNRIQNISIAEDEYLFRADIQQ